MGSRYVFTPFHYILCHKDRSVEQTWLFLNCRLISSIEYRLYLCSHSIIIHLQQFKLTYIIRCFLSNDIENVKYCRLWQWFIPLAGNSKISYALLLILFFYLNRHMSGFIYVAYFHFLHFSGKFCHDVTFQVSLEKLCFL